MGAAAVFETAAETPPTIDNESVAAHGDDFVPKGLASLLDAIGTRKRWKMPRTMKRTQEVDHEALDLSSAQVLAGQRTAAHCTSDNTRMSSNGRHISWHRRPAKAGLMDAIEMNPHALLAAPWSGLDSWLSGERVNLRACRRRSYPVVRPS